MFKGPLDQLAWWNRQALLQAGLEPFQVPAAAGPQTAFAGGSGPMVVLLHGAGDQAGTWAKVVPALLERHSLVVPDLAGHGDSAPATGPIEAAAVVDGLEALLASLAGAQAPTLVGNSLGAWMALVLAHRRRYQVRRVVAVNGGPLRHEAEGVTLMPRTRAQARETLAWTRDPGAPELPDAILDDLVRIAADGPLARFAAAAAGHSVWLLDEDQLGQLRVPVRLIWGASDRLLPLAYAQRMLAALPDARLVTLERCGHVPQQEAPGPFLAALLGVLSEADPSGTGG
jgi:pimeloyl-ACP methyl ester carboxylesterase